MKKLFLFIVAIFAVSTLWAQRFQVGDLYYNITSDSNPYTVEVTYKKFSDYSNYSGLTTANIPASVPYNGKTYSVTSIGEHAFSYSSSLTSVTIPNSVTSIGESAFSRCYLLTSVTIPNSVTTIGKYVFTGSAELTSVTIGNSVTSIEEYAFYGCSKLTSITIGNSVKSIGENAFYQCSSLTSITIPASVKSIGASAFTWCSSLTKTNYTGDVASWCDIKFGDYDANPIYKSHNFYINDVEIKDLVISNSVDSIHDYAFRYCSSLTSVAIGNSVTNIGEEAFAGCDSLYSITFPKSITSIGNNAFRGTLWYDSLPDGVVYVGKALYKYKGMMPANTSIDIEDGTISISENAFAYCSSLTSITIPNSITSIGDNAFSGCTFTKNNFINNSALNAEENNYWGADFVDQEIDGILIRNDTVISYRGVANSIVIPDGVVCIGGGAFYNLGIVKSITIPASVKSIESSAFELCYSLSSIDFGTGIMTIGNGAFSECFGLTAITIPNSVTSIGSHAFNRCSALSSIGSPENVTYIGEEAFHYTKWYQNQPDGALYIGKVLYEYIGEMPEETSFVIKEGTTHICQAAFMNCKGLMSVTIPNSVTSIGGYAFWDCSSLTSIEWNAKHCSIPKSNKPSSNPIFSECPQISSFTFGDSVEYIPSFLCFDMKALTSIVIPNSVTTVGEGIFYGCNALESVVLSENITEFPSLQTTNTYGKTIYYGCFGECSSLKSISIPHSTTNIGRGSFSGCSSLVRTNYTGSIGDWCNIKFGNSDANPICYSDNFYINDVEIKDLIIPNSVDSIHNYAFYGCDALTSVTIPNSVTSIGYNAFAYCDSLTFVAIGSGVTNIESYAFRNCPIDTVYSRNPTPPQITTYTTEPFTSKPVCYIPCGATSSYKNSSWKSYMSQFIEGNVYFLNTNVSDSLAGRVETIKDPHCDEGATFQAIPNVGYEFVQWSDGVTDALRTLDLTQDTTLIAEFRQLFDGKCGDNLYWKHYDDKIIIHGEGAMYDYAADSVPWYQFRDIIKTVEVFDGATSIGNNAFTLCKNLNTLTLSGTIENIGENAFGGCRMLFDIYCYILFPPIASENSFVNYNAYLYILCDYQRYYEADMIFGNFRNMQCIGTQSTPTDGMVITPSYNDVTITWPTLSNAGSYTLAINKDGEVFCTLTFNAAGQLTGIAFAPSRNGQRHAPAATQATNGFTFTVTGLDQGTDYSYNLVIKDNSGKTLQTYSGEFRTQSTSDCTVTVEYDATQGQVTGAGVYQIGDTVTLTAIPNDGYRFVRWSNEVENNPYTFVISENIMLSAEFTIEQTAVENITTNENIQKIIRNNQLLILRDDKTYNIVGQIVE